MKKIDDIFKNGINETGLPYSDQEWQATEKMIADYSTKPTQGALFEYQRDKLLGIDKKDF